jgi:predicted nuclease of predicted toxin-antitoxin system
MSKFLANENVPVEVVELARQSGLDIAWVTEIQPGMNDEGVLALALAEQRVLVTFDKDFGEMAFRQGKQATCGVVLFRVRLRDAETVARLVVGVLSQQIPWEGHFSVAREGRLKTLPLPKRTPSREERILAP